MRNVGISNTWKGTKNVTMNIHNSARRPGNRILASAKPVGTTRQSCRRVTLTVNIAELRIVLDDRSIIASMMLLQRNSDGNQVGGYAATSTGVFRELISSQ